MDTCILINTCTLYFNLLEPQLKLLKKYWSDCPFPIYVNIDVDIPENSLDTDYGFTYIKCDMKAKGENILDRLLYSINKLKDNNYKYVLLLLEDQFLTRKNNNTDIINTLNFFKENINEVGCMLLHPSPVSNSFYKKMDYQGYQFSDNIYQSTIPTNSKIIDHICGHCIDKLYIKGKNYFPHRDADLRDKLITPCDQPKSKYINWCKLNRIVAQVAFWDIEFLLNGLNKLINPSQQLKVLKDKEVKNGNDWMCFEIFATKYSKKFNIFNEKYILTPDKRSKIIYQNRGFMGACVSRGWLIKWGRDLFEENNIQIPFYNGYYVINNDFVKNQKKYLTDREHHNYIDSLNNKHVYTN